MVLLVVMGSLTILGCGGGDDDNAPTSGQPASSPAPAPAPAPVSFSRDIQPIFTQNCAKVGCHAGATSHPSSKPLNLEAGQAYTNIVAVFSGQRPTLMRVQPGD